VKLDVFKLWLDHGKRPSDASYEYMVVPATTIEKLEQNASKNKVTILANTPDIQAVLHSGLRMCQAIFYKAGEVQIIKDLLLQCETPGIIILQAIGQNGAKITVSDPGRELGKMHFSISAKIDKEGDNYKAVWNEKKGISEITIDLPQGNYAGESVTVKLD